MNSLMKVLFYLLVSALSIYAQSLNNVQIHGFGGWGYGRTDGNNYIIGSEKGEFRNINFSLNLTARPYENLTINTQAIWETDINNQTVQLDYAFAEWRFSDLFQFRIGKIKTPFGIYTEVFDVGTTRPFYSLPQSLYGTPGLVTKSYLGIGLSGSQFYDSDWGLQYDLYMGQLFLRKYTSPRPDNLIESGIIEPNLRDMIGLRLTFFAPVSGLRFGMSGYSGEVFFELEDELLNDYFGISGRHNIINVFAEYLSDSWMIRSEYTLVHTLDTEVVDASGFYFEPAYNLDENWQVSLLYGQARFALLDPRFVLLTNTTVDHEEFAFGLNYRFNPFFVLKSSLHVVDGNLFATPDDLVTASANGTLEPKTILFIFGTHFSF